MRSKATSIWKMFVKIFDISKFLTFPCTHIYVLSHVIYILMMVCEVETVSMHWWIKQMSVCWTAVHILILTCHSTTGCSPYILHSDVSCQVCSLPLVPVRRQCVRHNVPVSVQTSLPFSSFAFSLYVNITKFAAVLSPPDVSADFLSLKIVAVSFRILML